MKKILLLLGFALSLSMNAQVPSYVPTNGLVGYWPFSGNANDESGNTNNGTVNGATLTTDRHGNANSAYSFNGTTNAIQVSHAPSFNFSNGQTVSFWIYRSSFNQNSGTASFNHIISKGATISYGMNIWADHLNNQMNYNYIDGNYNTANGSGTSSNNFNLQEWVQYIITNNLNVIKTYKNGVLVSQNNITNPSTSLNGTNLGGMNIGKGVGHYVNERGFDGKIDDIGIWNRALTQTEITDLYNSTLSTSDFIYNKSTTIYPNPATGIVNVSHVSLQEFEVAIYDVTGKKLQQQSLSYQQGVDVSALPKGVYFLEISNTAEGVKDTHKLIKQ
jgi:hypothetical protein